MIVKRLFIFLMLVLFTSCHSQIPFDRQVWIENSDIQIMDNPRLKMIDDIKDNHLKRGMKKREIIKLLGKPYSDTISVFLPKSIKFPDSLKIDYHKDISNEEIDSKLEKSNAWYKENYVSAPIISYSLGWSLVDLITLQIRLNEKDEVVDYWIHQH